MNPEPITSMPSIESVQQIWTLTLVVFVVVLLVVALLLTMILRAARDIRGGVAIIWNVGQRIANNTVQLSLLSQTNDGASAILRSAGGIVGATGAIKGHAAECPGCPACVLGPRWAR